MSEKLYYEWVHTGKSLKYEQWLETQFEQARADKDELIQHIKVILDEWWLDGAIRDVTIDLILKHGGSE